MHSTFHSAIIPECNPPSLFLFGIHSTLHSSFSRMHSTLTPLIPRCIPPLTSPYSGMHSIRRHLPCFRMHSTLTSLCLADFSLGCFESTIDGYIQTYRYCNLPQYRIRHCSALTVRSSLSCSQNVFLYFPKLFVAETIKQFLDKKSVKTPPSTDCCATAGAPVVVAASDGPREIDFVTIQATRDYGARHHN